ncbi:hypothetical protein NEOLI_004695 [Neolecta irregularis DAH-3]|uniref:Uncharacterized protein n=1 Tax=Neolecta irregularis (strain DAH-3) TaxID=1198029 RepID=A0A1U7LN89_NEOID|nr:hypothetical protein NEOLI_004695 [Neolecta irregularis DAH-3]|eukprot:OLL24053.1 hypothetical protein NEOLI_004695 [Neolecta irregularis DAH-3]
MLLFLFFVLFAIALAQDEADDSSAQVDSEADSSSSVVKRCADNYVHRLGSRGQYSLGRTTLRGKAASFSSQIKKEIQSSGQPILIGVVIHITSKLIQMHSLDRISYFRELTKSRQDALGSMPFDCSIVTDC